ncbi:MAG: serine hydrolase [Bacteroidota bacterium]
MKKIVFFISAILIFSACLKEDDPFLPYSGISPQAINDGWEIVPPESVNIDRELLEGIFQKIQEKGDLFQLRSLLVFRDGKLAAENYFKDPNDISTPRPIWSCTKQIVGVLTGKAIEKGAISNIDDSINEYLAEELKNHEDKKSITIEQLLTMRSGIDFDETKDVAALLRNEPTNTIDFILNQPMAFSPGEQFSYNSGQTHLVAASLQNSLNRPLEEWADEVLFSKIGFTKYTWLKYDGYNFGGFGISTTPRELAKMAQLVLNNGKWNGEQIIDSTWIDKMITSQTVTEADSDYSFGYLWWVNEKENLYFMAGSGGQYACVVPDKNMLVVAMSEHDTDGDLEIGFEEFMDIVKDIKITAN